MSDIEQLRQDVIDAAKKRAANDQATLRVTDLRYACDALDAAMKPDPWKLLAEIEESAPVHRAAYVLVEWRVIDEVKAALRQHRQNQKGAE